MNIHCNYYFSQRKDSVPVMLYSRKGRYPDMLGRDTSGYEMQTTTTTTTAATAAAAAAAAATTTMTTTTTTAAATTATTTTNLREKNQF